jgi:Heterokaryon incompatibility protein Het-C
VRWKTQPAQAGDKLSESSVSELTKKVSDAQGKEGTLSTIKNVISQVPSGGEDTQADMKRADEIQQKAYSFDPDNYTTEEVQQTLWEILGWRDTIMRKISTIIEKIPGMEMVLEQLTDALNVCKCGQRRKILADPSYRHLHDH